MSKENGISLVELDRDTLLRMQRNVHKRGNFRKGAMIQAVLDFPNSTTKEIIRILEERGILREQE